MPTRRALLLFLIAATPADAQPATRLTFDVISIKESKPGASDTGILPQPGGQTYQARNMTVKQMFSFLYRVPFSRLSGGPNWLDSMHWDIDAKSAHSHDLNHLHTMFQNLLVDEFNLQFHVETKEGSVYTLRVDKSGLKMKPNQSPEELTSPIKRNLKGGYLGTRVPMDFLCAWLVTRIDQSERPVIDETGLTGFYDFTLEFLPDLPPGYDLTRLPPGMADWPSIFTALKEQLGLKLEARKGPIGTYIIDSATRPASN